MCSIVSAQANPSAHSWEKNWMGHSTASRPEWQNCDIRQRINDFQIGHTAALAGHANLELYASDPRRVTVEIAS